MGGSSSSASNPSESFTKKTQQQAKKPWTVPRFNCGFTVYNDTKYDVFCARTQHEDAQRLGWKFAKLVGKVCTAGLGDFAVDCVADTMGVCSDALKGVVDSISENDGVQNAVADLSRDLLQNLKNILEHKSKHKWHLIKCGRSHTWNELSSLCIHGLHVVFVDPQTGDIKVLRDKYFTVYANEVCSSTPTSWIYNLKEMLGRGTLKTVKSGKKSGKPGKLGIKTKF